MSALAISRKDNNNRNRITKQTDSIRALVQAEDDVRRAVLKFIGIIESVKESYIKNGMEDFGTGNTDIGNHIEFFDKLISRSEKYIGNTKFVDCVVYRLPRNV